MTYEQAIELAADAICNSREFCGDIFSQKEAAYESLAENGIHPMARAKAYRAALIRANEIWNEYRKAAGVPAFPGGISAEDLENMAEEMRDKIARRSRK